MSASVLITSFIEDLPGLSLFTTRDLLHLGTRAAVDNTTSKLVKTGKIKRVARGVFSHLEKTTVSIHEVAKVKAASFGRKILTHAKDIAEQMGFSPPTISEGKEEHFFATDGRTSKFRFGAVTIHFKAISLKKMQLGDSVVGKSIRVLCHLGKSALKAKSVEIVASRLDKSQISEIILRSAFMPFWLSDVFQTKYSKSSQQKIESFVLYESNENAKTSEVKERISEHDQFKYISFQKPASKQGGGPLVYV